MRDFIVGSSSDYTGLILFLFVIFSSLSVFAERGVSSSWEDYVCNNTDIGFFILLERGIEIGARGGFLRLLPQVAAGPQA